MSMLVWHYNRLRKMGLREILKRLNETLYVLTSALRFGSREVPYSRFCRKGVRLSLRKLPGIVLNNNWKDYKIFGLSFDLTRRVEWHFSENAGKSWPNRHFAHIDYRPGNPFGDVRINWELNRLQFLPQIALYDERLARELIWDWLKENSFQRGPSYISAMEVAIRFVSIYWCVCLFKEPLGGELSNALSGLALASGSFIEKRLSTHSSAGNHLIVEGVGLFWIGRALGDSGVGQRWTTKARNILWREISRQIYGDGGGREQSFWYLGFVVDAILHYFLLESPDVIPVEVRERIVKALDFIDEMTLADGTFPDYGDRDDGCLFRLRGSYDESPFPGLINTGRLLLNSGRPMRMNEVGVKRLHFWKGQESTGGMEQEGTQSQFGADEEPSVLTYRESGVSLMKWGQGRLLFRHANLGLENMYGHGHADALSVLLWWGGVPVLIDPGSGQYNGTKTIRDYFRSTIAHNTVEVGGKNQATIAGPFMWVKSYETELLEGSEKPDLCVRARHDGYSLELGVTHKRTVRLISKGEILVTDCLACSNPVQFRGALHLGSCKSVERKEDFVAADFGGFGLELRFPTEFKVEIFCGSGTPFLGWRSPIYGKWVPCYAVTFSSRAEGRFEYELGLRIV